MWGRGVRRRRCAAASISATTGCRCRQTRVAEGPPPGRGPPLDPPTERVGEEPYWPEPTRKDHRRRVSVDSSLCPALNLPRVHRIHVGATESAPRTAGSATGGAQDRRKTAAPPPGSGGGRKGGKRRGKRRRGGGQGLRRRRKRRCHRPRMAATVGGGSVGEGARVVRCVALGNDVGSVP